MGPNYIIKLKDLNCKILNQQNPKVLLPTALAATLMVYIIIIMAYIW